MPEVYALRTAENLNSNRRSSPATVKNDQNAHSQKPEMYYLRPNNDKQILPSDVIKPSSLNHLKVENNKTKTSDDRSSPVLVSMKPKSPIPYQSSYGKKPEMYYLSIGNQKPAEYDKKPSYKSNIRQQSKSNPTETLPDIPYPQKSTMFMLKSSNGDNFLPQISRARSPPKRPVKKNQVVRFALVDNNDKHDISNKEHDLSTTHSYGLPINTYDGLSIRSKAAESIQRSMNKYRFNGN